MGFMVFVLHCGFADIFSLAEEKLGLILGSGVFDDYGLCFL